MYCMWSIEKVRMCVVNQKRKNQPDEVRALDGVSDLKGLPQTTWITGWRRGAYSDEPS